MNECRHGLPFADWCAKCDALFSHQTLMHCPYCEQDVLRYPEEITVEMTHPGAVATAKIRWTHCGVIRYWPLIGIIRKALAVGCKVEYVGEPLNLESDLQRLAGVKTPADMGFVS